jgi:hypothetical protein
MTIRRCLVALGMVAAVGLVCPAPAQATVLNEELVCPADNPELDKYSYMRAVYLDLKGTLPDFEMYQSLAETDDVPTEWIDEWLASDEFAWQVVRRFRALLWPNIVAVALTNYASTLQGNGNTVPHYRNGVARFFRNGVSQPCLNEPAQFTADGVIVQNAAGQEGYVWMQPYWAPETQVKVCAFDAQQTPVSPNGNLCNTSTGLSDPGCGCGPNLRVCRYGVTHANMQDSFETALEKRIFAIIKENKPFTALFSDNRMWVNGPMSHFLRFQTEVPAGFRFAPLAMSAEKIPIIDYTDTDTWEVMELPPEHAGILTDPVFLARFQRNRGRANQFYNSFLCQPFQPPEGGIDVTGDAAAEPDLQIRHGCKYCHAIIEPTGSFWGRWAEQGAGYLDPVTYPDMREDCETCALTGLLCSFECRQYYLVTALSEPEVPYLGWLNAYVFRKEEHVKNIEHGPNLLAMSTVVDHRIPGCAAKRAATWLLGRALRSDEAQWVDQLAVDFVKGGYKYQDLVKQIVTSPVYRRVR